MRKQQNAPGTGKPPILSPDVPRPVRFIYENPSQEFGWSYIFGVREAFARDHLKRIQIEMHGVERGADENVSVIVSNFFDRVAMFREKSEGINVYWMILRITVPRPRSQESEIPAMICSIFSRTDTLRCRFDGLFRSPDALEAERLAYYATSAAGLLPVENGAADDRRLADSLLKTVFEGLRIGAELAYPSLVDQRFRVRDN